MDYNESILSYYVPDSLFVQDKVSSLIRFPLKSYKLPTDYRDKVKLDTLSNDLSHWTRYKPNIVGHPRLAGVKCQIICGYREIQRKRQRIHKLCALNGVATDDDFWNDPKIRKSVSNFSIARGGGDDDGQKDETSKVNSTLKPVKGQGLTKSTKAKAKNWFKGGSEKKSGKTTKPIKIPSKRVKTGPKKPKENGRDSANNPERNTEIYTNGGMERTTPGQELDDDKGHLADAADLAKAETTIYIDPDVIEKPVVEQEFLKVDIPEIEEEDKGLVLAAQNEDLHVEQEVAAFEIFVPPNLGGGDERDIEWLQLSSSNEFEAEERAEADLLYKVEEKWMLKRISVESQLFVGSMSLFLKTSKCTGRSFFFTRPEYQNRIIEFVVDRRKEFIYFSTSIILWIILGLVTQATVDVAFGFSDDDYSRNENAEFTKFAVPLIFMIGQLAIVALWSILVLLNYGLRMAHFFNTWSVALTEMEIDASKGIFLNVVYNNLAYVVYALLIIIAFGIDEPTSVSGSMGIFTILLLRNLVPHVAATSGWKLVTFQVIGLILHLYIMYCVRLVFTLIHIYSFGLRNASQMWNLKFALRLGQIPTGTSGYLKHLKIRQTLMKVWLHHRLLTGLCHQLGDIFAMPIMVSFFVELAIVVYVLTLLFKWAYDTREKREKYINQDRFAHTTLPSQLADVSTALFVLLYIIIDFVVNSYCLASAGQAFRDGFEFVRRKGLILCNTSHERRLIQSLQWSFSATNATEVNLLGFFAVNWVTMLSFMSIALLLWSLIIQLQQESNGAIVIYTPNCLQKPRGKRLSPDDTGLCRKKLWHNFTSTNYKQLKRVPLSELDSRMQHIIKNIKASNSSLESKARRRRRQAMATKSILPHFGNTSQGKVDMMQTGNHVIGNCLQPLLFGKRRLDWKLYYQQWHEKCHSAFLNETFIVPKLYGLHTNQWQGHDLIDCGIFPFPLPSVYGYDCAGQNTNVDNDYDDCGWKKTNVDDQVFGGENGTVRKISIKMNTGVYIQCWNIFSAIKRCNRIKMLNAEKICEYSRTKKYLDNPHKLENLIQMLTNQTIKIQKT